MALLPFLRRALAQPSAQAMVLLVAFWVLPGCSVETRKVQHLQKGDTYFAEGKYEHAEIEYRNALELDLTETRALRQLGIIAYEQGRMGLAIVYLKRAKELAPLERLNRAHLGLAFLSVGNRAEASIEALAVLDQDPANADAAVLLAESASDEPSLNEVQARMEALSPSALASPGIQVALGIVALKRGQAEEARRRFNQALTHDPSFTAAHAALGAVYSASGQMTDAESAYARAAELSAPRSPRRLQYASFKQQSGDLAGARRVLAGILEQAPDTIPAKIKLAELAWLEGKYDESNRLVTEALTSEPNHPDGLILSCRLALQRNEPAFALAQAERLLWIYPRSTQALYEKARALLAQNEISQAESALSQVLAVDPDHQQAIVALASMYLRQDDRISAIALLKPWLERMAPDEIPRHLVDAHALLAEALRGNGQLAETLKIYERIERVAPGREHLALMRGIVQRQQNNLVEARRSMEQALERNPASSLAIEQLVGLDVAEKKIAQARSRIAAALASRGEDADLHLLSARLSLAERNRAAAEASIRRANELQPNRPQGYLLLARIQLDAGEETAALTTLRAAVQRSPRNTTAWLLIGTLEEKSKNYDASRVAYEKLVAIAPTHVPALNNLAALLSLRFRDYDKAYELARKARELAPGDPVVADTLGWIGYLRGDYAWALGLLRDSHTKLPNDSEVQYHLAKTYYMLGEELLAEKHFAEALSRTPSLSSAPDIREKLAILRNELEAPGADPRAPWKKFLAEHPNDPVVLSRLAAIERKGKNFAAANDLLLRAVQASPDGARFRLTYAQALADQGQSSAALDQARIARKLAPDNNEIALSLGLLSNTLGDYAWSFTVLQEVARRVAPTPDLLKTLASSAYAMGRVTEAREALAALLRLEPDPLTLMRLTLIEASLSRETAEREVSTATLRLASDPKDVAARMVLAVAAGTSPEARSQLESVLTLYPDFVPAKRHLVLHLYQDPSQDARTLQLGTQARELLRTDMELNRALGLVVFRSGDYRRALGLLESSTDGYPKDAELWYYVGRCYQEIKQNTPAVEALNRALTLGLRGAPAEDAKTRLASLGAPLER